MASAEPAIARFSNFDSRGAFFKAFSDADLRRFAFRNYHSSDNELPNVVLLLKFAASEFADMLLAGARSEIAICVVLLVEFARAAQQTLTGAISILAAVGRTFSCVALLFGFATAAIFQPRLHYRRMSD